MIVLAFLLAATASRVVLVDEVIRVPASQVRVVEVSLQQRPALVECSFEVVGEGSGVRVVLLSEPDAKEFQRGRAHRVLAGTHYRRSGSFRHAVQEPGRYRVIVDNRMEGRGFTQVHLRVHLDFSTPVVRQPVTLSRERKLVVILASLAFLAAVFWWPGRRLLAAIVKRSSSGQPPTFC